jgi:hypothetical protein
VENRRLRRIEQLRRVFDQGFLSEAAFEQLKRDVESHANSADVRRGGPKDDDAVAAVVTPKRGNGRRPPHQPTAHDGRRNR